MHNNISVICPVHGPFTIQANNHVKKMSNPNWRPAGCPECGRNKTIARNIAGRKPFEQFVSEANEVHNFKYAYSLPYTASDHKVHVICSMHGSFYPVGTNHLRGTGCPRCKNSRGETKVAGVLDIMKIKYKQQHGFEECVGDSGKQLKFDFWLPELNTVIEYDGEQHFTATRFHHDMTQHQADIMLVQTRKYDEIKTTYALNNGIRLIRIPYTERHNINNIINNILLG